MKAKFIILLVLALMLSGCQIADIPHETTSAITYNWMAGESPVPATRTGIHRQGLNYSNFECTDNGVYFVCTNSLTDNNTFILYGDHGSDTLIKLCGRPDCTHTDNQCNAYLYGATQICYYDGYLYADSGSLIAPKIVRMDQDGSNRVTVLDTNSFVTENRYSVCFFPKLSGGLFMTYFGSLDSEGRYDVEPFYCKLDDPSSGLEPLNGELFQADVNGSVLQCVQSASNPNAGTYYLWDPDTNTYKFLTEFDDLGYYNETEGYYFRDGKVYRLTYATGQEDILFETGLEGDYQAIFFPDCICIASREDGVDADKDLYFYNWAYEFLGSAAMDFPNRITAKRSILGETPERIILTDSVFFIPRYYIEKSDFGTGNIEIHEYNIPDLEEELAAIDKMIYEDNLADQEGAWDE